MSDLIHGLHGLLSERCICGARKQPRKTFCLGCYSRLKPATQRALYRRVGDGYEEAFSAAVEELKAFGRLQRTAP